jgi:hypothetical protein
MTTAPDPPVSARTAVQIHCTSCNDVLYAGAVKTTDPLQVWVQPCPFCVGEALRRVKATPP